MKKILQLAVTSAVLVVIVFASVFSGAFDNIEKRTYDHRMKTCAPFFSPSEQIGVVLLDQDSLNWASKELGWSWPWPRSSYAAMLNYFTRAGAASVAFDMIYSEPSVYGKEDDMAFAQACRKNGKTILAVHTKVDGENFQNTMPIPELAESCALIANVTGVSDSDGVIRQEADNLYGSSTLSFAGLLLNDSVPENIRYSSTGNINIRYLEGLERYVPYKAMTILQSEFAIEEAEKEGKALDFENSGLIDPEQFKDNYVFFGLYAPGLFDICSTPVSANYQGVGVHISLLDTVLQGSYLAESPVILVLVLCLAAIAAGFVFGSSKLLKKLHSIVAKSGFVLIITAVYLFISYFAFYKGLILPVLLPVFSLLLSFVAFVFEDYITEGHQKKYIKAAFSQYLSPAVINELIENPSLLKLGGEEREITAYFSDVQGFTSISENLSPVKLTEVLNKYLSAMTDIILSNGGTIDKYEGDAIIAFWNAPAYQKDHANRAIKAALECQKKLEQMAPELEALSGKVFRQRIGLNTGPAVVGNMGSVQRFDYTMMGDTVNLASRLEGINKQFATYTMCSEATMKSALANGCTADFRPMGTIAVVGKKTGINVFVPMENEEFLKTEQKRSEFNKGLELFTAGKFEEAKKVFESVKDDGPSLKYIEKCENLIKNPPENWDGVIRATEK